VRDRRDERADVFRRVVARHGEADPGAPDRDGGEDGRIREEAHCQQALDEAIGDTRPPDRDEADRCRESGHHRHAVAGEQAVAHRDAGAEFRLEMHAIAERGIERIE
jgi:hypothetical protein